LLFLPDEQGSTADGYEHGSGSDHEEWVRERKGKEQREEDKC
jgi:hypothetical protein